MGVQVCLWILLMGVVTVWGDTANVSPQIPYVMQPARVGRQDAEIQPLPSNDSFSSANPFQGVTEVPQPQQEQEDKKEGSVGGVLPVPLEDETLQSNVVLDTTEQGPPPPPSSDDAQSFTEEREELLKKIKLLEEANRNLRMTEKRTMADERNVTFVQEPTINTLGGSAEKGIVTTRPVDCADHLVLGATRSGVYDIYPFTCLCSKPVQVHCDMETDGGGWTVFLTRENQGLPPVSFNRSWSEFKAGFGLPGGEYWLGNEILHTMTSSREYALRMDIQLSSLDFKSSHWQSISVDNEINRYKLTLGTYSTESTTSSNCLPHVSGRYFTTYDRDYDSSSSNCGSLNGGFWHYNCNTMFPTSTYGTGLISTCYNKRRVAATFVQLKIRPVICGSTFKTVYLNSYDCDSCH